MRVLFISVIIVLGALSARAGLPSQNEIKVAVESRFGRVDDLYCSTLKSEFIGKREKKLLSSLYGKKAKQKVAQHLKDKIKKRKQLPYLVEDCIYTVEKILKKRVRGKFVYVDVLTQLKYRSRSRFGDFGYVSVEKPVHRIVFSKNLKKIYSHKIKEIQNYHQFP